VSDPSMLEPEISANMTRVAAADTASGEALCRESRGRWIGTKILQGCRTFLSAVSEGPSIESAGACPLTGPSL